MFRQMLKTASLFGFFGPLVGLFSLVFVASVLDASTAKDWILVIPKALLIALQNFPLALIVGFIPAALAGLVYGEILQTERHRSIFQQIVIGSALGLFFSGSESTLLYLFGKPSESWWFVLIGPGTFSGAVLALASSRFRPTHQSTGPAREAAQSGEFQR